MDQVQQRQGGLVFVRRRFDRQLTERGLGFMLECRQQVNARQRLALRTTKPFAIDRDCPPTLGGATRQPALDRRLKRPGVQAFESIMQR